MKSIKKIALIAVAAIMSISLANAQVGIQAGYSSAKSSTENSEAMGGFHVGPIYNMSIQGPISLQYGLLYNLYTNKEEGSVTLPFVGTITGSTTHTQHVLDLPVRLAASFPLGTGMSAFAFAGPNFSFGLADNLKYTLNDNSTTANLYDNEDYSRFDLQLGLGAGLQYNNMGVKFSYDFGMLNRIKDADPSYQVNNMKIGLFYNF